MFMKLWAFLTRQEIIFLEDCDGEISKTLAFKVVSHSLAKRHWPFDHHIVILNPDGSIGNSRSYVSRWFK